MGGVRLGAGRKVDENSERSRRAGFRLGRVEPTYDGPVPAFPLPEPTGRELEVWATAWRGAQGNVWSSPAERWRVPAVGLWCRTMVRCEDPSAGAAILAQLHRLADQVGLTTAGLAAMGWKVVEPDCEPRPSLAVVPAPRRLRGPSAMDRARARAEQQGAISEPDDD